MMKMHMRNMSNSLSEDECNAFLARLTEGASGSKPIWKGIKAVKEWSIDKFMNVLFNSPECEAYPNLNCSSCPRKGGKGEMCDSCGAIFMKLNDGDDDDNDGDDGDDDDDDDDDIPIDKDELEARGSQCHNA
jgi:hypothetical protein